MAPQDVKWLKSGRENTSRIFVWAETEKETNVDSCLEKKTNENKLNWLTTTIHKFWQIGCSRLKFEKRFFGYSTYLCLQYICDFENLAPLPAVLSVASKVPNDSNWRSKFKRCGDFLASPKGKPISKTNKIHQCFICKYI